MKIRFGLCFFLIILSCCPAFSESYRITVSGNVRDNVTGESLIGAAVVCGNRGTITNSGGNYSLDVVHHGEAKIVFSYLGYSSKEFVFKGIRDTVLNVSLSPDSKLSGAVVTANKAMGISSPKIGMLEIPVEVIKNIPMLFGESDVLKTIQFLPGVQTGTDGLSGIFIRGGAADENLILLDGNSIYNSDHCMGLFSVFQPEAVKKITLYKGAFPAKYGGRVSGILDINPKDGNIYRNEGEVTVGLINNKISVNGPLFGEKTTYNFIFRSSNTIGLSMLKKDIPVYFFYDANLRVCHRFSDKNKLVVNLYNSSDRIRNADSGGSAKTNDSETTFLDFRTTSAMKLKWGTNIAMIKWSHIFTNKLFFDMSLAYNRYKFGGDFKMTHSEKENGVAKISFGNLSYGSGVADIDFKLNFEYNHSDIHNINFGISAINHKFFPGNYVYTSNNDTDMINNGKNVINRDYYGMESAIYVEDDMKISDIFRLTPGLRFVHMYANKKHYFTPEPRLSLMTGNEKISFKAAYSIMNQYVHLLSSSKIILPMDLWVPITDKIPPVRSHQVTLGFNYDGADSWKFSVETYYKFMKNVLEYKDGVSWISNNQLWHEQVALGIGRSYGVEFLLKKVHGKTTGWIGYTLSKSDRCFPSGEINRGRWFPFKYDRRHKIDIILLHKFNDKFDFGATWQFLSGGAITVMKGEIPVINPRGQVNNYPDMGDRNNFRLPSSHLLNLSFNYHKRNKSNKNKESIFNISIYNVYNRKNPNWVFPTIINDDEEIELAKLTLLPIIPSFTYTYKF